MRSDHELLRLFVESGCEEAFTAFVRSRIDFVYGTALRQVRGDAALAEEVAQNVFIAAARKAAALSSHRSVVSWLYSASNIAAANVLRGRARWNRRQQEAYAMQEMTN